MRGGRRNRFRRAALKEPALPKPKARKKPAPPKPATRKKPAPPKPVARKKPTVAKKKAAPKRATPKRATPKKAVPKAIRSRGEPKLPLPTLKPAPVVKAKPKPKPEPVVRAKPKPPPPPPPKPVVKAKPKAKPKAKRATPKATRGRGEPNIPLPPISLPKPKPKPKPVAKAKPKPKPKPVAKAKPKPAPTKGKLTRGPGSEAPPPPPRIRITEEAPKIEDAAKRILPPPPPGDRFEAEAVRKIIEDLPARVTRQLPPSPPVRVTSEVPKVAAPDKAKIQEVLKDLEKKVLSSEFKTPTPDEIAEAVTKATGGRYTPPATKVAEPPPPKAEPVVPEFPVPGDPDFKITSPGGPGSGAGQVTLPTKPSLPKGVAPGGRFYDDPITGDPMYQPPMPGNGIRAQVLPPPINLRTGKPVDISISLPSSPTPTPRPVEPVLETTPAPTPTPAPAPAPTPTPAPPAPPSAAELNAARQAFLQAMDPLQGVRERYVPTNILGQSFDPGVREDYARRMMQAGANVQQGGSPTFQVPTSAVPQVQFGGYGAPAPMAPLAPYAGLGSPLPPPPPPQLASGAVVNPGTGEVEPVGIAPPPRIPGI